MALQLRIMQLLMCLHQFTVTEGYGHDESMMLHEHPLKSDETAVSYMNFQLSIQ